MPFKALRTTFSLMKDAMNMGTDEYYKVIGLKYFENFGDNPDPAFKSEISIINNFKRYLSDSEDNLKNATNPREEKRATKDIESYKSSINVQYESLGRSYSEKYKENYDPLFKEEMEKLAELDAKFEKIAEEKIIAAAGGKDGKK